MQAANPGFGARLVMAFVLPWKLLFDGAFAGAVARIGTPELPEPEPEPQPEPEPEPVPEPKAGKPDATPAMQLLAILQREGRFIDFLQEDVASFDDAQIGGAARVVHSGCNKALKEYLKLEPVRSEGEGAPVRLAPGFDPARTRVTGNVVGEPPFDGRLAHHGWQVASIDLPELAEGFDPRIVAPAEVEL